MIPKFRVWLKKKKKMVATDDLINISFEDEEICVQTLYFEEGLIIERDLDYYEFDEIELMKSTGLKDKNGKEIFEGDILKSSKYITSVFYERGAYCVKFRRTPNTTVTMNVISFIEKYKTKVIGNIYENPELLEVENGE